MFALIFLLPLASATLTFVTPPTASLLQSYGTGEGTASLLLSTSTSETIVDKSITINQAHPICTDNDLTVTQIAGGNYNLTATLAFDAFPGEVSYTVSVITRNNDGLHRSYTASGVYHVYGVALYEDVDGKNTIYTGDTAPPLSFEEYSSPARKLLAKVYSPDVFKLQTTAITIRGLSSDADSELIATEGVIFDEDSLSIQPSKYRVGQALIIFEIPELEVMGETFETQIVVSVSKEPNPPPVVVTTGEVNATQQEEAVSFMLDMFNVPKDGVYAEMCGERFEGLLNESTITKANQTLTFYGTCSSGHYEPEVFVVTDDEQVKAVTLGNVSVRVSSETVSKLNGRSGGFKARVWAVVGAVVSSFVTVAILMLITFAWRARLAARALERSYSSTGADFGSDLGVNIARDVYGRGSVTYVQLDSV